MELGPAGTTVHEPCTLLSFSQSLWEFTLIDMTHYVASLGCRVFTQQPAGESSGLILRKNKGKEGMRGFDGSAWLEQRGINTVRSQRTRS